MKLTFRSFYCEAPSLVAATPEAIVIDAANKGRLALGTESGMPGEMPLSPTPFDEPSLSSTPLSVAPGHRSEIQFVVHDDVGVIMTLSGEHSIGVIGDHVAVLDVTYGGPEWPQVFSLRFVRDAREYLWLSPLPIWFRGRATPDPPQPGQLSLHVHSDAELVVIRGPKRVSWVRFDELTPVLAARDADVTFAGPHWEVTYAVEAAIGPVAPQQSELEPWLDHALRRSLSGLSEQGVLPSLTAMAATVAVASLEADRDLGPKLGVFQPEPDRELVERTTTVALAHLACRGAALDPAEALTEDNTDRWPSLFDDRHEISRCGGTIVVSSPGGEERYHGHGVLDEAGIANRELEERGDPRRYHPVFAVYDEPAALLLTPEQAEAVAEAIAIGAPLEPPPRATEPAADVEALVTELEQQGWSARGADGALIVSFDVAGQIEAMLLRQR